MELIDRSALVEKRETRTSSSLSSPFFFFLQLSGKNTSRLPSEVDLSDADAALKANSRVKASRLLAAETFL